MNRRIVTIALAACLTAGFAGTALAEEVNCANEFRSGKLYFSQQVYDKSVDRFAIAVEVCPDEWEYRARYAMALCELGNQKLVEALTVAETREAQDALIQEALDAYATAGTEFDTAVQVNDRKKVAKFVRENREHYWVEHYNRGIKLFEEEKYVAAEREFRLARLVDPKRAKAYNQGAVALIKMGQKTDAAKLVQEGLALDPENKNLNELIEKIYLDAARELTQESEAQAKLARELRTAEEMEKCGVTAQEAVAKAEEAVEFYQRISERREHGDPNVIFDRGVARMAAASAEAVPGNADKAAITAKFTAAAEDFSKAAEMVPADDEQNRSFHLSALFNLAQAHINADNWEGATDAITRYLKLDCMDQSIWQLYATVLSIQEKSEGAVAALMVSKSLAGQEVPVADAVGVAKADAAGALASLGEPGKIYTYQEQQSGNQINTWFWPEKNKVMSFILGVKNGEMTW